MKDVLELICTRRSVRAYSDKVVPKDLIEKIIKAGLYAASGMNRQESVIIAVTDKVLRDELSEMNAKVMGSEGNDPFYGAPVVLVVLASKKAPTYVYDGALVIGNMMLEAHELGLGSCWIHRAKEMFESKRGKEILAQCGISGEYEGIGNVILGYPQDASSACCDMARKPNRVFWK